MEILVTALRGGRAGTGKANDGELVEYSWSKNRPVHTTATLAVPLKKQ